MLIDFSLREKKLPDDLVLLSMEVENKKSKEKKCYGIGPDLQTATCAATKYALLRADSVTKRTWQSATSILKIQF